MQNLLLRTMVAVIFLLSFAPASVAIASRAPSANILEQFRKLDADFYAGKGLADLIRAAGTSRTAGNILAWGASYLWDAYITAYEVDSDKLWLDKLICEFDAAFAVRDDLLNHADYKGRVRPVWGTLGYTGNEYYAWAVHNGVAAYQILRFVKLIMEDPSLQQIYGKKAANYVQLVREIVDAFDEDWRTGPQSDQGYYSFPADMPSRAKAGNKLPLNQHNAMGLTLFLLADITGEQQYLDKAQRMAEYFRSIVKLLPNGTYAWTYWGNVDEAVADPPQKISSNISGEDISHAAINARFAYEAYKHGVTFDEGDMRAIARTVVNNIWAPDARGRTTVNWQIDGTGNRLTDGSLIHIARGWTLFAQFDPRVFMAAQQTYLAAPENSSAVLRLLGSAQLARWNLSNDEVAEILRRGKSGDPLAASYYINITTPQIGAVLAGPTHIDADIMATAPFKEIRFTLDDNLIYSGTVPPPALTINAGELSDGPHTLQVTVIAAQPAGLQHALSIPFLVTNTRILHPAPGAQVQGMLPIQVATSIPAPAIAQMELLLDERQIHVGSAASEELLIDTKQLPDGFHRLDVKVATKAGATSEAQVHFRAANLWTLDDPLDPPLTNTLFGITLDNAKTYATSDGWRYAADHPEDFFDDKGRRIRLQNSTEYLVWDAPQLHTVETTLYVQDPAQIEMLRMETSTDGEIWQPLSYAEVDRQISSSGWYKLKVLAKVPADRTVGYFKITLIANHGSFDAMQLGQVQLTGMVTKVAAHQ